MSGGRPRRDPNEVANIVRQAITAGETRPARAIARHYGCSLDNASKIISRARQLGADVPYGARGPKPASAQTRHDEVARIALAAIAAKQPAAAAVAEHFKVPHRRASSLISRARTEGKHSIPYDYCQPGERDGIAGTVDAKTVPVQAGLRCACGHRTGLIVADLIRHTMSEHGRPPTREERTPVTSSREVAA